MTELSNEAFAVMAVCPESRKYFGITVDKIVRISYKFVWAFKIDKKKAHREGYDSAHVLGSISLDANYPGCPYCGEKRHVICSNCNMFFCHHGQQHVTCPNCGTSGEVVSVDKVDIKGGGF